MVRTAMLEELGITLPTPAYLAGLLLFGVIGIAMFTLLAKRAAPDAGQPSR